MLNLTDEQKAMFYSSGYYKGYRMVFDDINLTIDNEIIHQESATITQSICSDEELSLGGCIASSIEFEVSEVMDKDVTGLEFKCYMDVEDSEGKIVLTIPMGVYRVDSAKCVDDKDYKKIIAYDALYDASVDIADFYNKTFPGNNKLKLSEFRSNILEHFGVEFAGGSFVNDDLEVEKTVEPGQGNLTGTMLLKYICEANGAFGYINRYGKFEEIKISEAEGLYPEEDLYPTEDLYPVSGGNAQYIGTDPAYAQYITTKFEEYETMPITCVTIKSSSDDIGVASDDDESNPYVISSNILFFGKSQEELKKIGKNIKNALNVIVYRPNDTTLEGLPYMDLGDWYSLVKERESVICPVFSRTLKGIQGLRDTFSAKGNKVRANETTSRDELVQLMGKSLEIKKSIDGLSVDVTDLDKRESSHFEQTSNTIVLKVDKSGRMVEVELGTNADDGKNYFKVTADNINLTAEELLELVGGQIHLESNKSAESLIKLSNYKPKVIKDGKELDVKYFDHGKPKDDVTIPDGTVEIEMPQVGELYYDLDSDTVYRFSYGDGAHWVDYEEYLDEKPSCDYNSTEMNTENGVTSEAYTTVTLDVENGAGGTTKQQFKNSNKTHLLNDRIEFEKTSYTTRMGTVEEETIAANITLDEEYDGELHKQPVIKSSAPIKIQNVKIDGSDGEKLSIPSAVSCTGLIINGMRYMSGSQVFTNDGGITVYTYIEVPDINAHMPVTAINGDFDACAFTVDAVSISPGGASGIPQIVISHSAIDQGVTYRVNYSYWANV